MVMKKAQSTATAQIVKSLESLKFRNSREVNKQKTGLIRSIIKRRITNPSLLLTYHETLCFMQAYPSDPDLAVLVDKELAEFEQRIQYFRDTFGYEDDRIDDEGLIDTVIRYPYSYPMARWLWRNFGDDVDIDWDDYNEKETDPLSGILSLVALYMENDGVDDENLSSETWIDEARGEELTSLAWLLKKMERLAASPGVKQYLYDDSELGLRWNLGKSRAARTLAKVATRKIYYHKTDLKKMRTDLRRSGRKSRPKLTLLSEKKGQETIDRLIMALLPRHRELYPATYANPSEVYVTSPGRGIQIYILGMNPDDRMPLETNYSALLVKNGVPIGYGIAVLFFERCEIAINVFDTFRSAEATVIFDHFLRVFYHHFGGRAFIMRRWQVGHENEEGLKSGSFWFYYKLGFRSIDPEIDELAGSEFSRIVKDPSYRSDMKTLKKLALSDMVVDLREGKKEPYRELQVTDIGIALTRALALEFGGDSLRGERALISRAGKALGNIGLKAWTASERLQFTRWGPLVGMISDLDEWTVTEKSSLTRIIRSKAALREMDYTRRLQKHLRLKSALTRIAVEGAH